ncbi:hypothetical protein IV203_004575 [Nitzschia inconspicua]|uniref:Uncharacterized protein n=1 Tax=Nitzschia inconspicua TaxID=303405 RepID=A0A9K3L400_9STRA|nr:hypothetical protein IV203_004575 [Nitzschia inconspicua]
MPLHATMTGPSVPNSFHASSSSPSIPTEQQQSALLQPASADFCHSRAHSFSQTIALNNAGARHMERGDYTASIKAFTSSFLSFTKNYTKSKPHLSSLRTIMEASQRFQSQSDSTPTPSPLESLLFNVDELFSWRRCIPRKFALDSDATETRKSVSSSDNAILDNHAFCLSYPSENDSSIDSASAIETSERLRAEEDLHENEEQPFTPLYSNPIHLPPDFPISLESCGFLSTTITLNLAMANHLRGLELQEQKTAPESMIQQHLITAGRYYEYTIRLERARQQEEQQRMTQSEAIASLFPQASSNSTLPPLFITPFALLVILNNLGQLHLALSCEDRSQKCYAQLQSTLMFLLLHTSNHTTALRSKSKDFEVFMENAAIGLGSVSSRLLAAAA